MTLSANNLFAKQLGDIIGVSEDTILNWENSRTYPCQNHVLLLKEKLNMNPFELIEFESSILPRQKSILNLIIENGSATRLEYQKLFGLRQQYAQNDLFFLYKLGILRRELGARKKATYFLAKDFED
jgi:transcriptional regulator with XRE-family HTH domain